MKKGMFRIEVPDVRVKLIISHTGFESREISAASSNELVRIVLVRQKQCIERYSCYRIRFTTKS